jgi:ABC-type transporter MlaC component
MKKTFLLATLLLIGFTFSYAQSNQTKAPMTADQKADEVVAKLKNEIGLTNEQLPKVKAITVEKINKVTAAHKKNGADKTRLQSANKLILEEWESQLKGIITEEQYKKYLTNKGL